MDERNVSAAIRRDGVHFHSSRQCFCLSLLPSLYYLCVCYMSSALYFLVVVILRMSVCVTLANKAAIAKTKDLQERLSLPLSIHDRVTYTNLVHHTDI